MTYTKGPWLIGKSEVEGMVHSIYLDDDGVELYIAHIDNVDGFCKPCSIDEFPDGTTAANARLIAAAPALLEALKAFTAVADNLPFGLLNAGPQYHELHKAWEQAKDALARAEGKETRR